MHEYFQGNVQVFPLICSYVFYLNDHYYSYSCYISFQSIQETCVYQVLSEVLEDHEGVVGAREGKL